MTYLRIRGAGVTGRLAAIAIAFVVAGCSGAAATAAPTAVAACKPSDIRLVVQIRGISNPYEASLFTGADFFAATVGLTAQHLTDDGDSQKQDSQIRALLATGNDKCTVLNILPNGDSDTPALVAAADAAGAWIVTQWNKATGFNAWDGHPTWISDVTYDDQTNGYLIAKALFDSMGGKGNIVALQGILDTTSAKARYIGLQKALAENPNVKLLDQQTAGFDRTQALPIVNTWLTKYGDQINGIWAANDDMGLGALQALKAAGKNGKVGIVAIDGVPDGIQAVKDGNWVATVLSNGIYQGGIGLAMGYCAAIGKLDVSSLPHIDRAFYAKSPLIDKSNVDQFLVAPKASDYTADWGDCNHLFDRVVSAVPAS